MTNRPTRPCPGCGARISGIAVRCATCGRDLTDRLPDSSATTGRTQDWVVGREPAEEPDELLDRKYRLVERIGEGGFGSVWKAEHVILGKTFAVKLLNPDRSDDPRFRETYVREGRVLTSLSHPNIVHASDLGVTEDGRLYMVMELAEGKTLRAILKEQERLPAALAVRIADEVLQAVEHAHEHGVVHRDLKPENVMVSGWGTDKLHVKVLDFGIAKILAAGSPEGTARTMRGWGTPPYASPEQMAGMDVDHRTDLYAVGVMLYEMATGLSFSDLLARVTPEPAMPLRRVRADLPAKLERAVAHAIAKDRRKRPESAAALRTELQGSTSSGGGGGKIAALFGCVGLLLALSGVGMLVWAYWPRGFPLGIACDPFNGGSVACSPAAESYAPGAEVRLTPTPATGWRFVGWSDGGDACPRDFVMPAHEAAVTARFAAAGYNVRLVAEPAEAGDIVPEGKTAAPGEQIRLQATPRRGWVFLGWSDGLNPNPRTLEMPAHDVKISASFAPCQDLVTVSVEPENAGSVTPGTGHYAHDTSVTFTATAAEGWKFVRWSDGETANPRTWQVPACSGQLLGQSLCFASLTAVFENAAAAQTEDQDFTNLGKNAQTGTWEFRHNKTGVVFVGPFTGAFTMGSPEAEPGRGTDEAQHAVTLQRAFYLAKTELTNGQYRRFRPEYHSPDADGDDQPVTDVSWDDAQAYCAWAGMRLPTEAEWEFVARAGDQRVHPWGNIWPPPAGAGNFADESARGMGNVIEGYQDNFAGPAPVGSFPANPFGVCDLAGNVWEWCADWYGEYGVGADAAVDPVGPETGEARIVRGGSFSDASGGALGCAARGKLAPDAHQKNVGFRVAVNTEAK